LSCFGNTACTSVLTLTWELDSNKDSIYKFLNVIIIGVIDGQELKER